MNRAELIKGFEAGKLLVQERENTHEEQLNLVDTLVEEKLCVATRWVYIRGEGTTVRFVNKTGDFT